MMNERSPDQLEREVSDARHRVSSTMDAIEDRLAPQQLVGEAFKSLQSYGVDTASNLGASVRQNPLALLLIGTGALLLLRNPNGRTPRLASAMPGDDSHGSITDSIGNAVRNVKRKVSSAADSVSGAASSARQSVASVAESARQSVHSAADSTRDTVRSATDSARYGMHSAADSASGAAGSMQDRYERVASDTRDLVDRGTGSMRRLMEEQPVVLGAVAMAVGAALAGMMPTTRQERQILEATRDVVASGVDKLREEAEASSDRPSDRDDDRKRGGQDGDRGDRERSGSSSASSGNGLHSAAAWERTKRGPPGGV